MYTKSKHLLPGCTRPTDAELDEFYKKARQSLHDIDLPGNYQIRWIGSDRENTQNILNHIRTGNKTGTVSVPIVTEHNQQPESVIGNTIILINFDHIELVAYAAITEQHTALDGPAVRPIKIWKPIHRRYFDFLLEPCGKICDEETIIAFETIEVVFDTENQR